MNVQLPQGIADADEFGRLPGSVAGEQPFYDLRGLWQIVWNRRVVAIWTVLGVLALTGLALLAIRPTYSATAVLMLDQRKNSVADLNAVLSGLPADPATVQNQIQILTSRKLAASVVRKLGLDRDPEFGTASASNAAPLRLVSTAEVSQSDITVDRLLRRVKVEQVGLSTTMTISVASRSAERSAQITNTWVDAYIEDQLNAKFEATKRASEWLGMRARELAEQVQADESAVQKYKAEQGIVDTAGAGGSLIDQQTANASGLLIAAKADLAQKTAAYNRILELQRAGRAADASEVVASPLIVQLRTQQVALDRQEAQYSQIYLPRHPKMVDIRAQAADTRARIAVEVQRIVEGLANDVGVARANVESLQSGLTQLQNKYQDESSASVKLKALQSIATASRAMYEALLARAKEVQGQEGIATPDTRIVSRAVPPTIASPNVASVMAMAIPGSLVLGLLFAFLAEGLDTTLQTAEQVGRLAGMPMLAAIPEVKIGNLAEIVVRRSGSRFTEAIRGLHLNLSSAALGVAPRVVLISSAAPNEGKTVVAVSLARLAARAGRRVVLVDGDFRRPSVSSVMGLSVTTGLEQVLRGGVPADRCLVTDALTGASVLACAEKPSDPADLAGSSAFEKLLQDLRAKFDLVVVDSAPLLPVHDTWSFARYADATVFVAQAGLTRREDVTSGMRALRTSNAKVAGIVLVKAKNERSYGEYLSESGGDGSA